MCGGPKGEVYFQLQQEAFRKCSPPTPKSKNVLKAACSSSMLKYSPDSGLEACQEGGCAAAAATAWGWWKPGSRTLLLQLAAAVCCSAGVHTVSLRH